MTAEERSSRGGARTPGHRRRRPSILRDGDGDSTGDDGATASDLGGNPAVRRAALAGLLALPWALYAYSTVSSNLSGGGISPHGRGRPRSRSLAAYQSCSLSVLDKPDRPVVPVYGASYPGSGSTTLHYLAEGLTGLEAGDDSKDKADGYDKVLIRTHYPAWKREVGGDARLMDRAILLIRNPLDALPGHASLYYEKKNKLPVNGETPASWEYWLEWRESHFEKEIASWSHHVSHWAARQPREKRLVVSYEHLVDEKRGMVEAGRVATFLGRGSGVEAVPNERVPCVWDKVVKYGQSAERRERALKKEAKEEGSEKKPSAAQQGEKKGADATGGANKARSLRASDDSEGLAYEYTEEQLKTVVRTLEELKGKFSEEYTLVVSLEEYREDCMRRLKKLVGNGPERRGAKKGGSKRS